MVEEYSDESIATGQTTSTWHKEIAWLVIAAAAAYLLNLVTAGCLTDILTSVTDVRRIYELFTWLAAFGAS